MSSFCHLKRKKYSALRSGEHVIIRNAKKDVRRGKSGTTTYKYRQFRGSQPVQRIVVKKNVFQAPRSERMRIPLRNRRSALATNALLTHCYVQEFGPQGVEFKN